MKQIHSRFFTLTLFAFSFLNPANATTLYYTFESAGTFEQLNTGELIEEPIQYIFQINGTHNSRLSRVHGNGYELYSLNLDATLVRGTGLEISTDQPFTSFSGYADYNPISGYFELSMNLIAPGTNGYLALHPHRIDPTIPSEILFSYDAFTEWAVGNLYAYDHRLILDNPDGGSDLHYHANNRIVLTSISEKLTTTNVPEPETYLLFGLGLLSVSAVRNRKLIKVLKHKSST